MDDHDEEQIHRIWFAIDADFGGDDMAAGGRGGVEREFEWVALFGTGREKDFFF